MRTFGEAAIEAAPKSIALPAGLQLRYGPYRLATETYEDSIALVRDHLSFLSAGDKEWLLRKTVESTFFAG
jgi:hypothetical protein